MKNKKGITLIALIITIIVLLILAGVSISLLTGENGVLSQAQESKEKTDKAHIEEMKQLTSANAAMNLEGYTYTDRTGKSVYIPSGFAVSENPDEQTVAKGLVIIDKMGDEFVWIPATSSNYVKRATKRYWNLGTGITDTNNDSLGDDYGANNFLTNNGGETSIVATAGGFFVSRYEIGVDGSTQRELMRPSDNKQDVGTFNIKYYENTSDTSTNKDEKYWKDARETDTTEGNTEKRQAIIDRILPQLQSKQGVEPVREITQDECLWLANEWKSGKDHQTGLITGTQWDRMVSWICDAGTTGPFDDGEQGIDDPTKTGKIYDSTSWGNYKNNLSTTYKSISTSESGNGKWVSNPDGRRQSGDSYRFVFPTGEFISSTGIDTSKKNVYDVAGNVWEWTTEVSQYAGTTPNYTNRVYRGGSVHNAGREVPATSRSGSNSGTAFAGWHIGFRCVLYVIKK